MYEWNEDGDRADSWAFIAGAEKGIEGDEHLFLGLDVKYSARANATFTETIGSWVDRNNDGVREHFEPKQLIKNYEYRFLANTSLVFADDLVDRKKNTVIRWTAVNAGRPHAQVGPTRIHRQD